MPSEPSGSDISGFVDLPTSPTHPNRHTEESSTFHLFLWIFMRVYLIRIISRIINGSTENRKTFEASARTCHNVAYASASWGVSVPENPISLEM